MYEVSIIMHHVSWLGIICVRWCLVYDIAIFDDQTSSENAFVAVQQPN